MARKKYKDFDKISIGSSDCASLVLVGITENGLESEILSFGQDDDYKAYIVAGYEDDVEIGPHYELKATFEKWMKIYDDDGLVKTFESYKIKVYRAGEMGCIIYLVCKKI